MATCYPNPSPNPNPDPDPNQVQNPEAERTFRGDVLALRVLVDTFFPQARARFRVRVRARVRVRG